MLPVMHVVPSSMGTNDFKINTRNNRQKENEHEPQPMSFWKLKGMTIVKTCDFWKLNQDIK
jgi:hypothetical protein